MPSKKKKQCSYHLFLQHIRLWCTSYLSSIPNLILDGYLQFIELHLHVMQFESCLKKKKKSKYGHTSSVWFVSARASRYPKPLKHPKRTHLLWLREVGGKKKKRNCCRKKNKTRHAQQPEQQYPTVPGRRLLTVTVSSQLYSCLCSS